MSIQLISGYFTENVLVFKYYKWLYFTLQWGLYCTPFQFKYPPVWYKSSHEYDRGTWRWNTETDETIGKR